MRSRPRCVVHYGQITDVVVHLEPAQADVGPTGVR